MDKSNPNNFTSKQDEINDSLSFCADIEEYKTSKPRSVSSYIQPTSERVTFTSEKKHSERVPMKDREMKLTDSAFDEDGMASIVKELAKIVLCVVVAVILAKILTRYCFQITHVEGTSMETQLHDGDDLIINKLAYISKAPERYDIIIFPFEDNEFYIKRVIGLPGETVSIKDGYVYINDTILLSDNYCRESIEYAGSASEGITLGENEYFVLGDNRNNSFDSRYSAVGVITKEEIVGKAVFRLLPFSGIGSLY